MNIIVKSCAIFIFASSSTLFGVYIEVQSSRELASNKSKYSSSIVSFYSPDCPHCKVFMPAYEAIANRYSDITFFGVNIDKLKGLRHKYVVTRTPTVYVLDSKNDSRTKIKGTGNEVKKAAEKIKSMNSKPSTKKQPPRKRRRTHTTS